MELLNKQEYKLLKLVCRKAQTVDYLLKKLHIGDAILHELVNGTLKNHIVCYPNSTDWKQGTIVALPIGKAICEERQGSNNRWRVPVAISIIALVKSCDVEIVALVRWISALLSP